MKRCINCNGINKDNDKHCRNCGYVMKSNTYYVLVNIGTTIAFIILLFVILLFIASYFSFKN